MHLDEAFKMLRKAVALRPEDGFIVDSLGWAHYRLGDYAEAVKELERAIELKPGDPTINDHLGDAYWRVGPQARGAVPVEPCARPKPEPEDLPGHPRQDRARPAGPEAGRGRRGQPTSATGEQAAGCRRSRRPPPCRP